jgi:pilus assembly protein CpaB
MIKGMTLPKGGNRLPLILGLVLGLVSAVLVVVYLSSAKDEATSTRSGDPGAGIDTVVAAQNIAQNTPVTAEMLKITTVPESARPSDAIGSIEGLVGKVTRVSISANEVVSNSKLIDRTAAGTGALSLVAALEPGQRAVSVQLSSLIGAGGNIRPGDYVDVILIVEVKPTSGDPNAQGTTDQLSATVLQNVKVLAVDTQRVSADPAAATDPEKAQESDELATTVTMAVTPTQGEVLAMADECGRNHGGRLSLALRGLGDTQSLSNRAAFPEGGPPPTCSAVLGISSLGE